MISVITVTYNAADTLEETLLSISRQTYRDFEIVAVDGGSTDGTVEVFRKYGELIGTLISEKDRGVYDAMNKGVRAAKGDILFFLNAQDTLYSDDVFEKVVQAFQTPKRPYVVFGDAFFTNRQGFSPSELTLPPDTIHSFKDAGPREPGICHQCLFYRRELFERLGAYDLKYRIYGDFDFNIRVFDFAEERYQYIPKIIVNFDLGGLSTRTSSKYIDLMNRENMELRAKYERMKRRTKWRKFLFSFAHAPWDGGYYIQLLGVRLDWTTWRKMFSLLPQTLPFECDLLYGAPDGMEFGGMENVLNGVSWFRSDKTNVRFAVCDDVMRDDLELRLRVTIALRRRGPLTLGVRLNGKAIQEVDFSSYCVGEQRGNEIVARLKAGDLHRGKNEIEFCVNRRKEADATFGLQMVSVGVYRPLPVIPYAQAVEFTAQGMVRNVCRVQGMYQAEDWGSWLHARTKISFRVPEGDRDLVMRSEWRVFAPTGQETRRIVCLANDSKVATLEFHGNEGFPAVRTLVIPREVVCADGTVELKVALLDPAVQAEAGAEPADPRQLAMGLKQFVLEECKNG